ncbi:hypothetical protein [Kocuria sp.]|uniref:hypothetical protein n=1 Tax=Kocuria sp. TaxID=1871328 RepID=UPI0026DCAF06|nr:hypothetical protein [Kocuria sp.]MDO4918866.1 hypothetical protein [Kocuria sp.]
MATRVDGGAARRRRRPARRTLALAAALTACLCVALVTTAVWHVGRQTQQQELLRARSAATWSPDGEAIVATSERADVGSLRAQGWAVPALASQGFTVADVRQVTVGGQPAVTVSLHDDHVSAEIVEQRGTVNAGNPLDGVSGLPVSAEGMHESMVSGSRLWIQRGTSWRAVMVRPDAVYTVTSDAPPATMTEVLGAVVAEDRGRVSLPVRTEEGFGATVADGLRTLFG